MTAFRGKVFQGWQPDGPVETHRNPSGSFLGGEFVYFK
ncbi:hypothetical protein B4135_2648 [Caldibacillus debilis]|uniref:Uncharacterized protein n=1 Tax=Caldibacillus debilis TaxID=301148 RepID=A0A150LW42_9BACI|nr:hypothetical protein B4135_2648 [Caldibacillus debilis]